jgi:hypothetical protein
VGSNNTSCLLGQPGINLVNNTSFASNLKVMMYTPCNVTVGNNDAGYGQIYAGDVDAVNNFTLHYVPVPTIPDATGGGAVQNGTTIAVVYERQLSSLAQA